MPGRILDCQIWNMFLSKMYLLTTFSIVRLDNSGFKAARLEASLWPRIKFALKGQSSEIKFKQFFVSKGDKKADFQDMCLLGTLDILICTFSF